MTPSSPRLNELQLAALARELDAIEAEARADLGEADLAHIRRVMRVAFVAEVAGRGLLAFGVDPLSFVLGTGALTLSKILENMEIGHNVMHGQYDWSRDPELDSRAYEWDIVSPSASSTFSATRTTLLWSMGSIMIRALCPCSQICLTTVSTFCSKLIGKFSSHTSSTACNNCNFSFKIFHLSPNNNFLKFFYFT